MNKNLRKKFNALNIFKFEYDWTACENSICLQIGEIFLLIDGLVPTISISSYSTGDF